MTSKLAYMHDPRWRLVAPVLLVAVLATAVAAQTPPRDTGRTGAAQTPTGTASVVGSVVVMGSGQPARNARVILSGGEPRVSVNRTTDDRGAFAFTALPAGRYTLTASKPGHVPSTFGQHRPGSGRAGTPIQLGEGQRFEARLQLPRGGALTGTIVDEHAEPAQGVAVRSLRYAFQNGQRTLQQAGSGMTDDRGIFRIFGLQPGDYVVCATPRNPSATERERIEIEMEAVQRAVEAAAQRNEAAAQAMAARADALRLQVAAQQEEPPQTGHAPVCFPGTAMPSSATAIALAAGEERAGIDFQLQVTPLGRVDGTIVNATGGGLQGVQVNLAPTGEVVSSENRSARVDGEGRFRFSGLPPGQYTIVARANQPVARSLSAKITEGRVSAVREGETNRLWATGDVVVDGRNPTTVVLTLQPGLTISGQIAFEGTSQQPPADLTRVRITALPQAAAGGPRDFGGASAARVDAGGRFTISGLAPGHYRLSAGVSGWHIESATISGQDALDGAADVRQNVTGAALTFTDRQTEFTGTAVNERNEPVSAYTILIFPAESRYWTPQSRRIQTARPGTDGRFTFRGLPPGDYRLATVFDPEPGSWYDPSFLQQLQSASTALRLVAGEKKTQDVRIPSTQ